MKLEPNHIDDIFRQRLHDAEVSPPAFVWPNVERELQKRKRRYFFLWLFACGAASAGLWAMFARHNIMTPEIATTQQVLSENQKEIATATELQNPSESQKPAPTKDVPAAPGSKDNSGSWSAKGDNWRSENVNITPLQSEKVTHGYPIDATETETQLSQDFQKGSGIVGFLLLETTGLKPLAFSRKEILPKAKPFIRKKKDPKYCYDFSQNPNVWMLDAYAGPSFSKPALKASDPAFEPYRQMRLATEQRDWAFNAGLRGSLLLGRHFLLRTGVHYEQMTEVFEYIDPAYVKYIVEIIHTPGEPVKIDTVGVEYGENYTKTYNRFGLLDIPLQVGGEVRHGRFGLSMNAGISLNVMFWKRGSILSQGGKPTPFTPGEKGTKDVFRSRTGLSAEASAQVFFHLQPTVRVFAEPYYRKILKPVTLDNQPVEQRYSNWGVKIGMTKILD